MQVTRLLLLCYVLLLEEYSNAITTSRLYDYGENWADQRLPPADEVSSSEFSLRTPFVFYGQSYGTLFVNMNGFISFLTEIPSFFNIQFPLDYPIIAALYSDVDTSTGGTVWFRETSDPLTIARLRSELSTYFSAASSFSPTGVVIATWAQTPGHKLRPAKTGTNTFQIILATDGHESYVVFLYADGGLQWLRGKGKNPSLPDALAQAGFISGDGRMKQLKGSGRDQVRNLDKWSNVGEPGVWIFRVGQIDRTGNVAEPDIAAAAEPDLDDSSCRIGGLMCHSTATCVDYSPGFCCLCPNDTFGNGANCVNRVEPLRVTGKVSGDLNGVVLREADLHSYVLTGEGRTYTAVSRVNQNQGYDMQTLLAIGTGISWLFAKPSEEVPNGFSLTGGILNRTVTIDFPQTGHSASVQQTFKGLDVFENVEVNTVIAGSLPTIPIGTTIELDPFVEEYTRVKRGQLRARSNRVYRLQGQQLETPFQVETTIDYAECAHLSQEENPNTLRLKVSENIFIQYDSPEKIVRFAISATVEPLPAEDPCIKGRQQCGSFTECVVDGDAFRCICMRGYEPSHGIPETTELSCEDRDECNTGSNQCHERAHCINAPGSYACECAHGYSGDGYMCQPDHSCETAGCDYNAACHMEDGQPRCHCPPHMEGDGYYCLPSFGPPEVTDIFRNQECGSEICGEFAECRFDELQNSMACGCRKGYDGDGHSCVLSANTVGCNIEENCSPYGSCLQESETVFTCMCLPGFAGDGYTCYLDTNFANIHTDLKPVPIDKIPEYVLGGDYSHLPVEFGDIPYDEANQPHYREETNNDIIQQYDPYRGVPNSSGSSYHQPETPEQPHDPNYHNVSYSDTNMGVNFDNEALRPAYPVDAPNIPAPYVPPMTPQEPLLPYQPHPEGSIHTEVDPICHLGTCFCPPVFKFDKFSGKCQAQSFEEYIGSNVPSGEGDIGTGSPRPYCGAAKCTCPEGYTYNEQMDSCDPDYAVEFRNISDGGNPEPDCEGGKFPCLCPPGFFFQYPQNTCEPRTDEHHSLNEADAGNPFVGDMSNPYEGGYPNHLPLYPEYDMLAGGDHSSILGLPHYPTYSLGEETDVEGRPVPECIGNSLPCICPTGYFFQFPQRTCEPRGDSNYNYGIKGGGEPNAPFMHFDGERISGGGDYPTFGRQFSGISSPNNGFPPELSCDVMNVCHEFAACIFEEEIDIHLCRCNPGFVGDGFTCLRQDFSCDVVNICHVNAECIHDDLEMRSVCRCLNGHFGDGLVCTPEDECNNVQDCDINAQCGFDSMTQRYRCSCNRGYTGDGRTCVPAPDAGCNIVSNCHHQADCVFDTVALTHRCQCRPGFEGDGVICNEILLNCNVLQNCGQHAQCRELAPRDYRCVCQQGYTGDGYYCQPTQSCQQDPDMCHREASCQPDPTSSLGYSCQCIRGYIGDGFTCVAAPTFESNLLLLNQGMSVLRMPIDTLSIGGGHPITVNPFMSAVGSDVDCFAGRYYWADVRTSTIRSSNYDGSERKPFVSKISGLLSPEDVAVDWISRNIYWTDSANDEIGASSIDEGLRRTVIAGDLINPRGIAVHPGRGLLFWSDWNRDAPKIESSGLDGSDRRMLVDTNIELPNSLVVDYETSTLCWADAGTHKIECIGVTGRDRRTVIKGPSYPYGLTLHQHHFYYTDWEDNRIHAVNKYTGTEEPSRAAPPGGSGRLYGIVAVPATCPSVSNACQVGRGGCHDDMLCLPNSSGGRTCACPANPPATGDQYQGCSDIVN